MVIPTGEYSDLKIQSLINKKSGSLVNAVGDSLLLFSHNYHRAVDDSINLYISKGKEIDNNGFFSKFSGNSNETIMLEKKKKKSISNLKKQIDMLKSVDIKKYFLTDADKEEIFKVLTDKELGQDEAEIITGLIVDYENLKVHTLKQDFYLAQTFLNNESNPNYEIELIVNQKSREFMKYQDNFRIYINTIESINLKKQGLDSDIKELVKKMNINIQNIIKNSVLFVKDGTPYEELDEITSVETLKEEYKTDDFNKKEMVDELLKRYGNLEHNYNNLISVNNSEVVKTTASKINDSTEQQLNRDKKKKTYN